jgi:uncharacterized membrane protein
MDEKNKVIPRGTTIQINNKMTLGAWSNLAIVLFIVNSCSQNIFEKGEQRMLAQISKLLSFLGQHHSISSNERTEA